MKKIITIFAAAAAMLAVASCGNSNTKSAGSEAEASVEETTAVTSLEGMSFTITELGGTAIMSGTDEPANINFTDGRANAYVGCNRIFAVYAEENGKLTLSEGGSTKMLPAPDSREDEFIEAFNKMAGYKMDGNKICFTDAEGNVLFNGIANN